MATTQLTTLANVKASKGSVASADDPVLTRLIDAVSAAILNYINVEIGQVAHTEYRDGRGTDSLVTKHAPILSVQSLTVGGIAIPASNGTSYGYQIADSQLVVLRGGTFASGRRNILIAYTSGYASVPGDIEQACIDTVLRRFAELQRAGQSSKTLQGETVSFDTKDLSAQTKLTLQPYRRVVPV